jgi:hypothetical protein
MLRTVPDGVKKESVTASGVKSMTTQWKPEGVRRRASRVKYMTAWRSITRDGVKPRSRQSENLFGGEMTAPDIYS